MADPSGSPFSAETTSRATARHWPQRRAHAAWRECRGCPDLPVCASGTFIGFLTSDVVTKVR
jgi:hypothetical protein